MWFWYNRHFLGVLAAACLVTLLGVGNVGAQSNELDRLSRLANKLNDEGKALQAVPVAERLVMLTAQREGEDHINYAIALHILANVYDGAGRYAEAETILKRSIALRERLQGPNHPDLVHSLNNLSVIYSSVGRKSEVEPLLKRCLAIVEKSVGLEHPDAAMVFGNLGHYYQDLGRFQEAKSYFERMVAIHERTLGPNHPKLAHSLVQLAKNLYHGQDQGAEAERVLKRSLAIYEIAEGKNGSGVAYALFELANLYTIEGRAEEAEQLFKRAIPIWEKAVGPGHPDVAALIGNLGNALIVQERLAEAEPLIRRSIEIYTKALGPEHVHVARGVHVLGELYTRLERWDEAQSMLERALGLREKLHGPDHEEVAATLSGLARVYAARQRMADAERLLKRGIAIMEKLYGGDTSAVGVTLAELAFIYRETKRYKEAEALLTRALAAQERSHGPSHVYVGSAHDEMARLYIADRRWANAYKSASRATAIFLQFGDRLHATLKDQGSSRDFHPPGEFFFGHVLAAYELAGSHSARAGPLRDEGFRMAQWASQTDASAAVQRMSARFAAGDSELARLVRERQDLVTEWQARDARLTAAGLEPANKRDLQAEQSARKRLAAIESRLAAIDQGLSSRFPQYADLTSAKPLSIAETQAQLAGDEALVLFFTDNKFKPVPDEALFLWVVTKADARWERVALSHAALVDSVSALRCGLDETSWRTVRDWDGDSAEERRSKLEQQRRAEHCRSSLKAEPTTQVVDGIERVVLPFDPARAHTLYRQLFGKVADIIKGKRLLIVPAGPLSTLPFQVLVTEPPPPGADFAKVAWLGAQQAISVLPSVASLRSFRTYARASQAKRSYLGFGNPLLEGGSSQAKLARVARNLQRCSDTTKLKVATTARQAREPLPPLSERRLVQSGYLKSLSPLPETAEELCQVAKSLGSAEADVKLAAHATEREVKALSANGALAGYRILHFASHGALAGEVQGSTESGLVLTPPARSSEGDDGFLSASEIAQLRLDADWVILSACNTAAAGSSRTEPLSGLARAFFYAGARALLVSHWAVDSLATVRLVTSTVSALTGNPGIGRAEAHRIAVHDMIVGGGVLAHPAYWAPFVVVGEGGR